MDARHQALAGPPPAWDAPGPVHGVLHLPALATRAGRGEWDGVEGGRLALGRAPDGRPLILEVRLAAP